MSWTGSPTTNYGGSRCACPCGTRTPRTALDVDDTGLLAQLFELNAGRFYLQPASEVDRVPAREATAQNCIRIS